jgi:hypothetical protein
MKTLIKVLAALFFIAGSAHTYGQEIQTLIGGNAIKSSGGYGALTNKFTRINGEYANLAGVYGGWYINHKFLLGVAGAAVTNNIPVPDKFNTIPGVKMSYEYAQFGLMTEYVLGSNRVIHVGFQLFSGAGLNTQYNRYDLDDDNDDDDFDDYRKNTDWFFIAEPGINVEINVFKWMRFCPGISYRAAVGDGESSGLKGSDINGATLNASLKFGKF